MRECDKCGQPLRVVGTWYECGNCFEEKIDEALAVPALAHIERERMAVFLRDFQEVTKDEWTRQYLNCPVESDHE